MATVLLGYYGGGVFVPDVRMFAWPLFMGDIVFMHSGGESYRRGCFRRPAGETKRMRSYREANYLR